MVCFLLSLKHQKVALTSKGGLHERSVNHLVS